MTIDVLSPNLELLTKEYVLVQAWKKTATYIRYHNWYSDTLELDHAAADLPRFLDDLARSLTDETHWKSDPLRIVPAPKSQPWRVEKDETAWAPKARLEAGELHPVDVKLRPLAHVSLRDQVAATALMLCLADRVESLQGDPRKSYISSEERTHVISYGNRLFCDEESGKLRHRWGSGKLYRNYYQDYREFLQRPEAIAETLTEIPGRRIIVVHSDLKQFFDRVRPSLLRSRLASIQREGDDPRFFALANRVLDWHWHPSDTEDAASYARSSDIADFTSIALPQGLVAAGFFANLTLLSFDNALVGSFKRDITDDIRLVDACRYVDDFRLVVDATNNSDLKVVEETVHEFLNALLVEHTPGLLTSRDKTKAALLRGEERLLLRQSSRMSRIQSAASGGFDAIGGTQILESVQGLLRAQERFSEEHSGEQGWSLSPVPDVRDATVARFAAGRFRSTYRSLRPLLPDLVWLATVDSGNSNPGDAFLDCKARTRQDLDDDARSFSRGLIEHWVNDPSNVRLLRIGLDLWPDSQVLARVLRLLQPYVDAGSDKAGRQRVAWFCLAEIFRAAATETGIVEDAEVLPEGTDIVAYRRVLTTEGERLLSLPLDALPWYLRQQVLLFLAAEAPETVPELSELQARGVESYIELVRFLRGERTPRDIARATSLAIIARRSFLDRDTAVRLATNELSDSGLREVCKRDVSFGLEILAEMPELGEKLPRKLQDSLCLHPPASHPGTFTLSEAVVGLGSLGPLRNEVSLLQFAVQFLAALGADLPNLAITPTGVTLRRPRRSSQAFEFDAVAIRRSRIAKSGDLYRVPDWVPPDERWRFQLGYLLRFILCMHPDFTRGVPQLQWRSSRNVYRPTEGHWHQRLFGFFNAHSAFGDDWLPISPWIEDVLSALLQWPGTRQPANTDWVSQGRLVAIELLSTRLREISDLQAAAGGLPLLSIRSGRPDNSMVTRPLRACVVQTVLPTDVDYEQLGLTLSDPKFRSQHSDHLAAALAAVDRMLALRDSHQKRCRLDLLVLPELAVRRQDVKKQLLRFARAHKTIVLAGLAYEEVLQGQPLVNGAIWILPEWSQATGQRFNVRWQGKHHLSPQEELLNVSTQQLQGFRPSQWLVEYEWSSDPAAKPLTLTAAVCYDATDLSLASALRKHSDMFLIPALNKDVGTFDQMSLALHYHMFQMVVVANNGVYGGSSAYAPYKQHFERQVFHLHGQPQASIAFFEIDDIADFLARGTQATQPSGTSSSNASGRTYKPPPAGLR